MWITCNEVTNSLCIIGHRFYQVYVFHNFGAIFENSCYANCDHKGFCSIRVGYSNLWKTMSKGSIMCHKNWYLFNDEVVEAVCADEIAK